MLRRQRSQILLPSILPSLRHRRQTLRRRRPHRRTRPLIPRHRRPDIPQRQIRPPRRHQSRHRPRHQITCRPVPRIRRHQPHRHHPVRPRRRQLHPQFLTLRKRLDRHLPGPRTIPLPNVPHRRKLPHRLLPRTHHRRQRRTLTRLRLTPLRPQRPHPRRPVLPPQCPHQPLQITLAQPRRRHLHLRPATHRNRRLQIPLQRQASPSIRLKLDPLQVHLRPTLRPAVLSVKRPDRRQLLLRPVPRRRRLRKP